MIVFFLAGMVAMILVRALHRDISRYNDATAAEDAKEVSVVVCIWGLCVLTMWWSTGGRRCCRM